jgi:hypothetical protein
MQLRVQAGAQVGEGSGGGGGSNSGFEGRQLGGEGAGAVDDEPRPFLQAAIPRDGDVDRALGAGQDAPELCGAAVAEDGALPAGEDSRHPMAFEPDGGVTNRKNASMKSVQPPA